MRFRRRDERTINLISGDTLTVVLTPDDPAKVRIDFGRTRTIVHGQPQHSPYVLMDQFQYRELMNEIEMTRRHMSHRWRVRIMRREAKRLKAEVAVAEVGA